MPTSDTSSWPSGVAPAPEYCAEDQRLMVMATYGTEAIGDEGDPELSEIAAFAARLCDTPIAFVSLIFADSQKFVGRAGSDMPDTPRSISFCAHALGQGNLLEVRDASRDPVFAENPLVQGEQHIRFYAGAPLISREGAPLGALCVIDSKPREAGLTDFQREGMHVLARAAMRRLSALRQQRSAIEQQSESARLMREIANLVPAIIWSADADGKFDYYSSHWDRVTALPPPKVAEDWLKLVHPDDTSHTAKAWSDSFAQGSPFESEFRLKQADGNWRWMMSRALPAQASDGSVRRWYGTLTDIDEGRRESENRDILARELSHRIKNIFAVVAGLVSIRARKHPSAQPFAQELNDAIRALGRAHDFVRPVEGAKGDSLRGLLTELMAPYSDNSGRVVLSGDDCEIGARAATPLAMIFHELATNSAKYGALSVPGGSIEIAIDSPENGEMMHISWREQGGPALTEPGADGFGSRLVQLSIEGQLGGSMVRNFRPEGLEIDLAIPQPAIRS
jgi:PAS domain S-box-containing protein